MKGRDAIASVLKQEGIDFVTCFPHNLIIESASDAGIRPILARTERVAVTMADGYARVSNGEKIGVVLVQQGPGSENAFSGVAQAFDDSIPLLLMPGGPPTRSGTCGSSGRTGGSPNAGRGWSPASR